MKAKSNSVLGNSVYILKRVTKWDKNFLASLLIYGVTKALYPFITPYIGKLSVDCITNEKGIGVLTAIVVIASFCYIVIQTIANYINVNLWWKFFYFKNKFITEKIEKAVSMDYEKLENPEMLNCMEKANKATEGTNGVEGMLFSLQGMFMDIIKIIISTSVMAFLSPIMVVSLFLLAIINFVITDKAKKADKSILWDAIAPVNRKINYIKRVAGDFCYAKDIRLYGIENWLWEKLKIENKKAHDLVTKSKKLWMNTGTLNRVIGMLQQGIIYAWLIYNVLYKNMTIGNFLFYVGCITVLFDAIGSMLDRVATIKNQSSQVNDLRTFLEYKDESNKGMKTTAGITNYVFRFENVSFKYQGQDEYALRNINLEISNGKRLAIVGLNGAGKTTLIKLLCRLYEVTDGRITLNGIDIREYEKYEYFRIFAPVFQDIKIFALSIKENVSMTITEKINFNKVNVCIKKAGLEEKMNGLEKGINTEMLKVLYEDGTDFSGGEKQKLALARALYKNASVVILDEPTSSLDSVAEYNMYSNFDTIVKDKTTIYISHRLSSTRFCDSIAMFEDGKIIEFGNHNELLESKGKYCKMYELQAQYYREGENDR